MTWSAEDPSLCPYVREPSGPLLRAPVPSLPKAPPPTPAPTPTPTPVWETHIQPTASKTEGQGCRWHPSIQRPEAQGPGRTDTLSSKQDKEPMSKFKGSHPRSLCWGRLAFPHSTGLQLTREGPPTSGRAVCFTQPTDLNVRLTQNTFPETSVIMFEQTSGHSEAQLGWHKTNHDSHHRQEPVSG